MPRSPCCSWCDRLFDVEIDIEMEDGSFMHRVCYDASMLSEETSEAQDRLYFGLNDYKYINSEQYEVDFELLRVQRPGRFGQLLQIIEQRRIHQNI